MSDKILMAMINAERANDKHNATMMTAGAFSASYIKMAALRVQVHHEQGIHLEYWRVY